MAAEMVAGAAIGAGLGDALSKLTSAIIYVTRKTSEFRSKLTQIQETITRNKGTFDEIETLIEELGRPVEEKEMFIAQLKGAEALILECEHIKWNMHKKYSHSLKLDDLNASLLRFCQIDVQLMIARSVLDLQKRTIKVAVSGKGRSAKTTLVRKRRNDPHILARLDIEESINRSTFVGNLDF